MALSEIAFLGDVHARMDALETAMQNCARRGIDTLVQVGDFWLYTEKDLTKFNRVRDRIEDQFGVLVDVHFIDGNHENFDLIGDTTVTKEMAPFMTKDVTGGLRKSLQLLSTIMPPNDSANMAGTSMYSSPTIVLSQCHIFSRFYLM